VHVPLTAGALKQALIGLIMPNVFLGCATLHNNVTKIYVVHSISRYPKLSGRATPWDGQLNGFLGDIVEDMVLNVVLPETIFDEVTKTLVYNAETFVSFILIPHVAIL
jgi:hypothetical protein